MDIQSLAASQGASGNKPASDKEQLDKDYDQFLQMLTTQMQNQDPLNPMDSAQFTDQLVQFSNVEQGIKQNEKLDRLLQLQTGNATTDAVAMIGKQVEVAGDQIDLAGGAAPFAYELQGAADRVEVQVLDRNGAIVRTMAGEATAGRHEMTWDGETDAGTALPEGSYTLVVGAVRGEEVTAAQTFGTARVTGVEAYDGEVQLDLGGRSVPLSEVRAVRENAAAG
jgi:flagellar basal-body rod modification protein FlgD